jgi:hypothetical protein
VTELRRRPGREFMALFDTGEPLPGVVFGDQVITEDAEQPLAILIGDLAQDEALSAQDRRPAEDVRQVSRVTRRRHGGTLPRTAAARHEQSATRYHPRKEF